VTSCIGGFLLRLLVLATWPFCLFGLIGDHQLIWIGSTLSWSSSFFAMVAVFVGWFCKTNLNLNTNDEGNKQPEVMITIYF
jgi:hypothetical protein